MSLYLLYPEEKDFFSIPPGINVRRFDDAFKEDSHRFIEIESLTPKTWLKKGKRIADMLALRKAIKDDQLDVVVAIERSIDLIVGLVIPRRINVLISEKVQPQNHQMWQVFGKYSNALLKYTYKRRNVFLHAQG